MLNKVITQESGIVNKLSPLDVQMGVQLVGQFQAKVQLTAFTKVKAQLGQKEVKESRECQEYGYM